MRGARDQGPDGAPPARRAVLAGLAGAAIAPWACRGAALPVRQLDPRTLGARGTGRDHDDAPAVQAAVDALWRAGGGAVRFAATPAFYHLKTPIVLRPGVSLTGDGGFPRIKGFDPRRTLLLAGNFHPDFISRARYDRLRPTIAGGRAVRFADRGAAGRYRVGDQVFVTGRVWGETGGFGLPHHGWLNVVQAIRDGGLVLREPIDVALDAQVTPLRETPGRDGIPLFFHADAVISGLDIEAAGHVMSDSAMLRVTVRDNRMLAETAVYGNAFQHVRWTGNDFRYRRAIGEQSLNSLSTEVRGNRFRYVPGPDDRGDAGFYIQEYARKLRIVDNRVDVGTFPGGNFLISIGAAQDVVFERFDATGRAMRALIYIGSPGTPDFPVTGNYVRDSRFAIDRTVRYVMVKGGDRSRYMHDNGVTGCTFTGEAGVGDAVRIEQTAGTVTFSDNRWGPRGACLTMGRATGVRATGNLRDGRPAGCRAIS